ncbi:6761_t:CDS:10 [Rhizophagus irregularis]|nr:6761_t:CDS:10 [Rhizophagus irregularis]
MQNCDSGQVSNDSNGVQEDTNDLTTPSQANYNEGSSDLANRINGLYRLLDLCYDDGSSGIVDKIIISKEYLGKLCNDMVPSSFKSISEINYSKLNSIPFRLIGCYGNRILIAKFLLNKNIIDQQLYELLTTSVSINDTNKPSLLPGIYFLKVNSNFGLIIHWPEIGCYENDLDASSQIKRNMVNLHRYLTKLPDHQICLMSDEDLEGLNLENSGTNVGDDSDDDYEVKKSQEEREDFNIDNGFKVKLSNRIKNEINNQNEDDIPLYPIVVESTTNQSFVTRQLIKGILHSKTVSAQVSMDINALELFVKHGLGMEKLLTPLYDAISEAKDQNEKRKDQEINTISEDIKIIQKMASIKLRDFERYFGKYIKQDNQDNCPSQTSMSDTDLERIRTRYPGIEDQIKKTIKIDSRNWEKMKTKYNLSCIVINKILEKTNESEENYETGETKKFAIETFYNMLTDIESDLNKLLEKYTQQSKVRRILNNVFKTSNIKKAEQMTSKESDEEFIKKLFEFELFEKKIINVSIEEYHKWKNEDFPNNLKKILPSTQNNKQLDKLKREYEEEKKIIEKNMFGQICNEIEKKYKDGGRFHAIICIKLDDNHQIQQDETYIPSPILLSNMNQYGTSFRIPEAYDFKKISQFDKDKFLLMLYNKDTKRIEIFFNTARQLAQNFKSHSTIKPFKSFYTDENFIIAVNEPKGLLAIYNTEEVKLDVFSFTDNRSRLYGRYANIQLLQWYSNIPSIKYFLFIKDTEELCFVENCGRARIFNLVNSQFRVTDCKFPSNLVNVLSSPDGSCIVTFTKEILDDKPDKADSIISTDDKKQRDYNNDIKEINRVYVYFSENFGGKVNKEFLQISCINNRQTHLISLDLNNGCFNSLLLKITLQKAKFRFQKCMRNHSLALQRTKSNDLINAYNLMFEKYPIDSCIYLEQSRPLSLKVVLDVDKNNNIKKYGEKFKKYVTKIFDDLKHSTKKPANILKEFSTSVITFQELDIANVKFQKDFSSEYQLGEWIIQLCCLIPIQIAVARNNLFQPLKDGLSSDIELGDDRRHVEIISKNISFGWYEGIFKHFSSKKVKIISSMGEQSCGKSFMLNHLVGTTFDGSAMRCTEGVWMSLVNTKECIYVALDFEGLRSLERTPQEDMFLTLFNTVVSNLILYKNQYTINRDASKMFQKFQDGARLCIIIKDVPETDKNGITKEFQLKLDKLVAEEGGDNFITKMYGGGLSIIAWPVFHDVAWFKKLSKIKIKLDEQETKYENAKTFLQNTKVIMAKLKICDWSSLNENLIHIRVATLKRLLPIAVSYGIEQKDPIIEPLVLSEYLRNHFEKTTQPRKESSDDNEWFSNFDRFLKDIIGHRTSRVKNWYLENTARFPQDNSDITDGRYALDQKIGELTRLWTLCGLTCYQCGLKCVKNCGYNENHDHKENHDCLTDHKCHFPCHFTEAHNDNPTPECRHKAGHKGKHACAKMIHLCGKACFLIDKLNCQKVCSKEIGHDDGEHLCQSKRNHYCGKDCSLSIHNTKGDYRCPNKCIISCEEEHDFHHCENKICPIQCPIPDCKERCQSDDHFHAFSGSQQVNHFCGKEHQCRKLCEEDGICNVLTEPKKQEETYRGRVEGTVITYTKYIQVSDKLKCNKKIPPNEFEHTGKHTHKEEGVFHYCDKQCPFCEYFCTLPYGHQQQIHDTKHGNMTQTEFTGEDDEFVYAGHNLRVGDQGTFVLCNCFCKDLGRHRHIDYCQNEENCRLGNQSRDMQHINVKVSPNPDKPKDFISHKLFWERTGFKDPYTVQEQQEFAKCDHECPDEKHLKSGSTSVPPTKSFCELQLFHAQLCPESKPPNDYGYISSDGHHFNCEKLNTAFHIVFVLDYSISMSEQDIKPIQDFPIYDDLTKKHNNRIGAVYQAVYLFMNTRKNSAKITPDSISLILFNHKTIVPFEYRDLTNLSDVLNSMLKYEAGGLTDFDSAIQKAGILIETHFDPTKVNVIIFLSDGECKTPTNQLNDICKQNKENGSPLYLYTVLFGSDRRSYSLEKMAEIAQSYHPQNSSSKTLRCQFTSTADAGKLVNHFNYVAESLRKHKPALLKKI